jgi:hypothetical protein
MKRLQTQKATDSNAASKGFSLKRLQREKATVSGLLGI